MRELRKDPVTQRWVIISTERGERPHQFVSHDAEIPDDRDDCPFCEGREYLTPPEIYSVRPFDSLPDEKGWYVRVVPDKEPLLDPHEPLKKYGVGMFDAMRGTGAHELVVETPHHRQVMDVVNEEQIGLILNTYRLRMMEFKQDSRIKHVLVTKNNGVTAGALIHHPHSHIIGLPIISKKMYEELEGSRIYFEYKDRCVFCDIVAQELDQHVRIVEKTDQYIAFCPFASRFPFEIWILPREHCSHYNDMSENDMYSLARIVRSVGMKLFQCLGDPPFNLFLHTAPFGPKYDEYYHWHFEIIPKLTSEAGFEWGSGFYINPTIPEESAELLHRSGDNLKSDLKYNSE